MTDPEIKELFNIAQAGKPPKAPLDIGSFCKMVEDAGKQRALPSYIQQEGGKDSAGTKIGQGLGMKKEQNKA